MKHDPGIRVYGLDEEPDFIAVTKEQAQRIHRLVKLVSDEGEQPEWTQEERTVGKCRFKATEKAGEDSKAILERLPQASERDAHLVPALLDLIEFGDGGCESGSWVLSIVRELLWKVAWLGPGGANEQPFGQSLLSHVEAYDYFLDWIEDARRMMERYPKLLPPLQTNEPATAPPAQLELCPRTSVHAAH